MTDRATVIKSLDLCQSSKDCLGERCPYFRYDLPKFCRDQLLDDALAVLKETEPRVMTWEEVAQSDGLYLWTEITSPLNMRNVLIFCFVETLEPDDAILTEDSGVRWVRCVEDYNRGTEHSRHSGWRCWTARPSVEERKAVPWK